MSWAGRRRWLICALIFAATTINYVDRQILSLVKEFLDLQFHWTKADYGLVNSLFQISYGLGMIFFGWLVDRFGVRAGYALSMIGWSVAAMAHALAQRVPETAALAVAVFGTCRVLLGFAEGGNFPTAIKAAAQWFPKRERAFATGIFNSGTNVGALVAPLVVPALALRYGWPAPFVLIGAIGFIWLAFWACLYESPEKDPAVTREELAHILSDREPARRGAAIPWLSLLRYRQVWGFAVAKFLTDPVWWFFLIWLPDYFLTTRGLDIKHSWPLLVAIYGIISVLSVFGGWATGHLAGRGWPLTRARKAGLLACALCMPPVFFATRVGPWAAVALIALAGSAQQAWSVNLFSTVSDIFPKDAVASVVGIGGLAGALGGMLCPYLTGRLLDRYQALGDATAGYAILFSICAFAHLTAFALNHLLAPSYEPVAIN